MSVHLFLISLLEELVLNKFLILISDIFKLLPVLLCTRLRVCVVQYHYCNLDL